MTSGISQENNEICLPEAQIRALFEDAQLYTICEQKKVQLQLLATNKDSTISIQQDLITNLESHVSLQDSLMTEMRSEVGTEWYIKYLFFMVGILFTSGITYTVN